MSQTRNFTIGHATVFQDKPSEETRLALERMHKNELESRGLLIRSGIKKLAELLADKEESELAVTLKVLVRETNRIKQENKNKNS